MKVLFLIPRYSEARKDSSLEKEIVMEFKRQGHEVSVVTLIERKEKRKTILKDEYGVKVLRVKTGNFRDDVNKFEKGLTKILNPYIFYREIKNKFKDEKFDLIITSTPLTNSEILHKKLKKLFNDSKVLTIIWDIFPQNAIDLGLIKNKLIIRIFRKSFHNSLLSADFITAMSNGNLLYLQKKFKGISNKVFILKNWAEIKSMLVVNKNEIRKKYNINPSDFIVIFGGNIGKPQKLENVLELAKESQNIKDIKFIFVGKGTERKKLEKISIEQNLTNVRFIEHVPREDYEKLTASCDLGLVSLDERFTIPNFPSKTTDYFKLGIPILALLDKVSYDDYGTFIQKEAKGGIAVMVKDRVNLKKEFLKLYEDKSLRSKLGINGRRYYEEHLGVEKAYKIILDKINGDDKNV